MTVLVTGGAGFIGFHVSPALLARGDAVLGLDNLNSYYDPALKQARLERLRARPGFAFAAGRHRRSRGDRGALRASAGRDPRRRPPRRAGRRALFARGALRLRAEPTSWAIW